MLGEDAVRDVIGYVAPVGENQETIERAMRAVHTRGGRTALTPCYQPRSHEDRPFSSCLVTAGVS